MDEWTNNTHTREKKNTNIIAPNARAIYTMPRYLEIVHTSISHSISILFCSIQFQFNWFWTERIHIDFVIVWCCWLLLQFCRSSQFQNQFVWTLIMNRSCVCFAVRTLIWLVICAIVLYRRLIESSTIISLYNSFVLVQCQRQCASGKSNFSFCRSIEKRLELIIELRKKGDSAMTGFFMYFLRQRRNADVRSEIARRPTEGKQIVQSHSALSLSLALHLCIALLLHSRANIALTPFNDRWLKTSRDARKWHRKTNHQIPWEKIVFVSFVIFIVDTFYLSYHSATVLFTIYNEISITDSRMHRSIKMTFG